MITRRNLCLRVQSKAAVFLLLGILITVTVADSAFADGMFISAPEWQIYESGQTAFIRLADGQEDLMILPNFHGNARDFAWIIPVPNLPSLDTADTELFIQAATLTQPIYRYRDRSWGNCEQVDYALNAPGEVQVISSELVGIYDTMTIGADNADALVDSLTQWGFLHAGNTATATPMLESYVDLGWYFVTLKVDDSALDEELPYLPYYWYGQMQPIHLSFESAEMVYPLRISALSATESSDIVIYTVGEHRMTFPGAQTWYANRISGSELNAIKQRFPAVGHQLSEGDFLTKLVRTYTPVQMSEDLVLDQASSDDEFRPVNYSGFPLFSLLFGGSALGWVAWRAAGFRRARRPRTAVKL